MLAKQLLVFIAATLLFSQRICAQETNVSSDENDLNISPVQAAHAKLQRDPSAVEVLNSYIAVVGSPTWRALAGSGVVTLHNGDATQSGSASLQLMGDHFFRIDTTFSDSVLSFRSGPGLSGRSKDGNAPQGLTMSERDTGFLLFPALRATLLADPTLTLIDDGIVVIGSSKYHKITMERQASSLRDRSDLLKVSPWSQVVTDLYFDPATSLLVKSAVGVSIRDGVRSVGTSIITYSDYRSVNGALIPFLYTQTLGGQLVWSLQMNDLHESPSIATAVFTF